MAPLAEMKTAEFLTCEQSLQLIDRVGRVPVLVDHRTNGQIFQVQMPEQLADHLDGQIVDAG